MMTYKYNLDEFENSMDEINSYQNKNKNLYSELYTNFIQDFVMLGNSPLNLFFKPVIASSDNVSTGACEVIISYQATSKFSGFLETLRAANW